MSKLSSCQDEATGLKQLIAIHNTVLGPSFRRHSNVALRLQEERQQLQMYCDFRGMDFQKCTHNLGYVV